MLGNESFSHEIHYDSEKKNFNHASFNRFMFSHRNKEENKKWKLKTYQKFVKIYNKHCVKWQSFIFAVWLFSNDNCSFESRGVVGWRFLWGKNWNSFEISWEYLISQWCLRLEFPTPWLIFLPSKYFSNSEFIEIIPKSTNI